MKLNFFLCISILILGCSNEEIGNIDISSNEPIDNNNMLDWSGSTHGNDIAPNYVEVFDDKK